MLFKSKMPLFRQTIFSQPMLSTRMRSSVRIGYRNQNNLILVTVFFEVLSLNFQCFSDDQILFFIVITFCAFSYVAFFIPQNFFRRSFLSKIYYMSQSQDFSVFSAKSKMAIPALDRLYCERLCPSCSIAVYLLWCTVFHVPGHKSALFPLYFPDFSPGIRHTKSPCPENALFFT